MGCQKVAGDCSTMGPPPFQYFPNIDVADGPAFTGRIKLRAPYHRVWNSYRQDVPPKDGHAHNQQGFAHIPHVAAKTTPPFPRSFSQRRNRYTRALRLRGTIVSHAAVADPHLCHTSACSRMCDRGTDSCDRSCSASTTEPFPQLPVGCHVPPIQYQQVALTSATHGLVGELAFGLHDNVTSCPRAASQLPRRRVVERRPSIMCACFPTAVWVLRCYVSRVPRRLWCALSAQNQQRAPASDRNDRPTRRDRTMLRQCQGAVPANDKGVGVEPRAHPDKISSRKASIMPWLSERFPALRPS